MTNPVSYTLAEFYLGLIMAMVDSIVEGAHGVQQVRLDEVDPSHQADRQRQLQEVQSDVVSMLL